MVLDIRCKLVAHLCGHKGMGDVLAFQIIVKRYEVQTQFLGDDMYGGTACQWRIDALLMYVEAVAGIFSHVELCSTLLTLGRTSQLVLLSLIRSVLLWLQPVVSPVPVTVTHQVAVCQLTTFRNTCRSTGIEQYETV